MALAHRETVESQGVEAVLLDVGEGHVELLRRSAPTPRSASSSSARGPAFTTSPTRSRTSTRPWRDRRRRPRADRQRGADRDPRKPRRLPPPSIDGRRADRDRRARRARRRMMAEAQRVEIGFEGGQVVSVRLTDARAQGPPQAAREGRLVRRQDRGRDPLRLSRQDRLPADRLRRAPGRLLARQARLMRVRTVLGLAGAATLGAAPVVAQESLGLPLRAALLGRSPAPDRHPRAAALRPGAAPGRAAARDRPRHRLLHLRHGRLGRPRGPGRDLRPPAGVPRPRHAGARAGARTSFRPRATRPSCPTRTPRWTPSILTAVLGEIPDPGAALREIRRVLQPGRPPRRRRAVRRPPLHDAGLARRQSGEAGLAYKDHSGNWFAYFARLSPA